MKIVALCVLGALGAFVAMAFSFPVLPSGTGLVLLQSGVDFNNAPTTVLGTLTVLGGGIILYLRTEISDLKRKLDDAHKDKDQMQRDHLEKVLELQDAKHAAQDGHRAELKKVFDESNDRYDAQLERNATAIEGISGTIAALTRAVSEQESYAAKRT